MGYEWTNNRPIKVDYVEVIEGAKKRLLPNNLTIIQSTETFQI